MAITRLAFCGSGAAYGTFEAKEEAAGPDSVTGYAAWQSAVITSGWLLWFYWV